MPLQDSLY